MAGSGDAAIELLRQAKEALETYADDDKAKKLFADEVDDIIRRVAAEIAVQKNAAQKRL
jgi:hypothetical protein